MRKENMRQRERRKGEEREKERKKREKGRVAGKRKESHHLRPHRYLLRQETVNGAIGGFVIEILKWGEERKGERERERESRVGWR